MYLAYLLRRAGLSILLGLRGLFWLLLAPVLIPYFAVTRTGEARAFADAARDLGLSPVDGAEPVFRGEIGSKTVILRPRDRATIVVLFATRIPLMLAYEDRSPYSTTQCRLDTTSWKLARRFQTRFVEGGTLDRYGDRIKPLWDRIADFDDDRAWFLREMAVEREGLVCRLRHYPGMPRIAVSRLRPLVEDIVELANELTDAFGEDPQRPVDPEPFLR